MDQATSNTLRTLGIVFTSIVLVILSGVLLLLSLCLGLIGGFGGSSGQHDPQTINLFLASVAGLVVVLLGGGAIIAKLARGVVHDSTPQVSTTNTPVEFPQHLSPASQTAVRNLIWAIAAQLILSSGAWLWSLAFALPKYHSLSLTWSFIVSGLLSGAPYILLLIALLRSPGRRTFAYALAIPAVLSVYSVVAGSSALLYLARVHGLVSLYSLIVPRLLHFVVFYFAWRAIKQIGVHPAPGSLILASFLTLGYFMVLPAILATLEYKQAGVMRYNTGLPFLIMSGPGLLLLIIAGVVAAVLHRKGSSFKT